MGLFDKFRKKEIKQEVSKNQTFGSPLVKIKGGDITKPFINSHRFLRDRWVDFGIDNLFPNIIDQMYYQSPLHSSIIDFQVNTAISGGFNIETIAKKSPQDLIKEKTFIKSTKLNHLLKGIALDIKMHRRFHLFVYKKDGKANRVERILPSQLRWNYNMSKYWYNYDWTQGLNTQIFNPYDPYNNDEVSIYTYVDLMSSPGQDIYPLDKTVSVYNWCYLDGESGVLQKKNIERSIFGNMVIKRPKRFKSNEEFNDFKKGIENKEGEVVPVLLLTADSKDELPEVESFPANQNDKAFENLDRRIDDKICQAHSISPIIMGIQSPGKLGSGSDIKESYPIWEKNVLVPFKKEIEMVVDDLLLMFNINGDFKLNDFKLIDFNSLSTENKTEEIENKNK